MTLRTARPSARPSAEARDPEQAAARLAERLGYAFRDAGLLTLALTHKSYANEHAAEGSGDNERLEFLGDAVLDQIESRASSVFP